MAEVKPHWPGALLSELQGPSSLAMAVSGGAVAFSASIINPTTYVGFWMSVAFQLTVGFQFLSVASGVLFFVCRLRNNDVIAFIEIAQRGDVPTASEPLERQSKQLSNTSRFALYASR